MIEVLNTTFTYMSKDPKYIFDNGEFSLCNTDESGTAIDVNKRGDGVYAVWNCDDIIIQYFPVGNVPDYFSRGMNEEELSQEQFLVLEKKNKESTGAPILEGGYVNFEIMNEDEIKQNKELSNVYKIIIDRILLPMKNKYYNS